MTRAASGPGANGCRARKIYSSREKKSTAAATACPRSTSPRVNTRRPTRPAAAPARALEVLGGLARRFRRPAEIRPCARLEIPQVPLPRRKPDPVAPPDGGGRGSVVRDSVVSRTLCTTARARRWRFSVRAPAGGRERGEVRGGWQLRVRREGGRLEVFPPGELLAKASCFPAWAGRERGGDPRGRTLAAVVQIRRARRRNGGRGLPCGRSSGRGLRGRGGSFNLEQRSFTSF